METSSNQKRAIILAVAVVVLSIITASWSTPSIQAHNESANSHLHPEQVAPSQSATNANKEVVARAREAYGKLPLSFETNRGQSDSRVKFISRSGDSALFLTSNGAVLTFRNLKKETRTTSRLRSGPVSVTAMRMRIAGANPRAEVAGRERLPGASNFFRGNDPTKWQADVPTYSRVQYRELYSCVNLVYYGNHRQLEYDFEVTPGGDPRAIKLAFDGVQKLRIDANGDLILLVGGNEIRMHKPDVYQEIDGRKEQIAGRYALRGKRQIGFKVGEYDKRRTLVIDPVLSYSTYLGGTSLDEARAIAVDSSGNAYVAGRTSSANFPAVAGSFDTTYNDNFETDVFVTKMNSSGTGLIYSTFIGGGSDDAALGIAIDSSGNAYVTGSTASSQFPTTPGAFRTFLHVGLDAFVLKLDNSGSSLLYSTFIGGSQEDQANAVAIDSLGNAYITGGTSSSNFPTTPGAFRTTYSRGSCCTLGDAFITKLNSIGTGLVYSTFLGGTAAENGAAIAVDDSGNATISGSTLSSNFPVTPGAYQPTYGGGSPNPPSAGVFGDAFVTRLNSDGTALVFSTYLGSTGDDGATGLSVDAAGKCFITGGTNSPSLPSTPGVAKVIGHGIAKSTNGGASWHRATAGLPGDTVTSINIDPANADVAYAGTFGGGVFKTTDGGDSWNAINSGLTNLSLRATAIVDSMTLYAGADDGLYRTTDGGTSWHRLDGLMQGTISAIAIDPVTPSTIYAGTLFAATGGLFRSTDQGVSWTAAGLPFVRSIVIDPASPSTVYAAGDQFYRSLDGGSTWSPTGLEAGFYLSSLAIDGATLYARALEGLSRSTDYGVTWTPADFGLPFWSVSALTSMPGGGLYAGTLDGVFRTTNGGETWDALNIGLSAAGITKIDVSSSSPNVLYASAGGAFDAFVAKLTSDGSSIEYLTYIGGSSILPAGFKTDSAGNAYVTGFTSGALSLSTGGLGPSGGLGADAFVIKLNPAATALEYSTYLGGRQDDHAYAITVDSSGSAYVVGSTSSADFPVTPSAFQSSLGDLGPFLFGDAFVTKLQPVLSLSTDLRLTVSPAMSTLDPGSFTSLEVTLTNLGSDPAQLVSVTTYGSPSASLHYSEASSPFFSNGSSTPRALGAGETVTGTLIVGTSCLAVGGQVMPITIRVESLTPDTNSANNIATAQVAVLGLGPNPISPTGKSFGAGGGTGTVTVTLSCNWAAISNESFITVTSGKVGSGNGMVTYSVTANNTLVSRTGTLTIAGQIFTVTQTADTDGDGIPDVVEAIEGTNPLVKDNAIFTNARLFVMQQYRDFLGREGEPGGITFWTNLINSGSLSRAQVIDSFFNSPEFQGTVSPVARLYFAYFLRIPDYGGLIFWVNQYRQGATLDSISQAFAASPEFQSTYGSLDNTQFVTLLYQNVLGRAPDPGGLAFWVGQLNSGAMTRGSVMLGFSESAEYKQASFNKVYATMIYVGMLRRAPEQGGFDFWVNALNSGASGLNLIQGFLSALEYHNRFLP